MTDIDPTLAEVLDPLATVLFATAIVQNRCGELLNHLFYGDGVTIDPETREIHYIPLSEIERVAKEAT